MFRLLIIVTALGLAFTAPPSLADEAVPKTRAFKIQLKNLPPPVARDVVAALKVLGIEANSAMSLAATTDDCPSACDDRAGGGFCYCSPTDGKCPAGTSGPHTDPGNGEQYCKTKMDKGVVGGGGLTEPVEVQMP